MANVQSLAVLSLAVLSLAVNGFCSRSSGSEPDQVEPVASEYV